MGRGAPGWAPLGSGNFHLRDPLFLSMARSGPGLAGLPGSVGRHCFSWEIGSLRVQRTLHHAGEEGRKSSYYSGTATLLLVVRACCCLPLECSRKKNIFFVSPLPPAGKPLSEMWRLEGTDLGALCQVLFVPGITSLDYCLTTSPSLRQSLSPPPVLAAPGFALCVRALRGVGSVCLLAEPVRCFEI